VSPTKYSLLTTGKPISCAINPKEYSSDNLFNKHAFTSSPHGKNRKKNMQKHTVRMYFKKIIDFK
jgi:hypothetical protein